ncbi:putative MFS multidrug transporter [Diaporthe sp. PMI_573]|nr:putative MFS multidrug transporter [Diaporthaceae sp. PMI_573]
MSSVLSCCRTLSKSGLGNPKAETNGRDSNLRLVTTNNVGETIQKDATGETGHLTGPPLVLALIALNISTILIFLDNTILSTATPTITNEFHSVQDIGWYVSSYQLALPALQPMTGKLFTYLPNKQTYIASVFLFELGSLICGLATSSNSSSGGVRSGSIGGPLIRGVAAVVLTTVRIAKPAPKPKFRSFIRRPGGWRRFGFVGTGLLVPAVVMLLLTLYYGGGGMYPRASATVIGLFCGAGAVGPLFVAWEWRFGGGDAMVPLSMFRERVVVAGCLTNLCLFSCTFITSCLLPLYFQSVQGSSPFTAGVHMLPSIISQLITAVLSGFAIVLGVGRGAGMQMANTIFDDSLASQIHANAPHVNLEVVIAAGATAFRQVVPVEDLPAVTRSYAVSFDRTFYLAVALSALCLFTSLGLGYHDVWAKRHEKGESGGTEGSRHETRLDASV